MGTKTYNNYEDLLTFTRASKGHALRPVSYGTELVTNGDFSDGTTGWILKSNATIAVVNQELEVTVTGSGGGFSDNSQGMTTTVGKIYKVTFDARTGTYSGDFALIINTTAVLYETLSPDMTTYEYIFVADSSDFDLEFARASASTGTVYFDNVSVKEVLFDQPDGTLTLFEHPNNIPRVEYDADGNRLGLLVEEARTNLVTYSEDFTESSWGKFDTTISADATASPDGINNADKIIEGSGSSIHRINTAATIVSGTSYTASAFVKADERSIVLLRTNNGSTDEDTYFDLSSGSITSGSGLISDLGNGWFRVSRTFTASASTTSSFIYQVLLVSSGTTTSYAGNGTSGIYIYGAQLEAGSFPTSYIKTTGSTATRSADVASIPVADFGFNASAGSFVLDASWAGNSPDVSTLVHLGDTSDRHLVYYNNGFYRYQVKSGNVVTVQMVASGSEENDVVAASYKKDSYFFGDGSAINSDTSGDLPTEVLTTLDIGGYSSDNHFNGHIKSIKYYPRQLTSAQLGDLV